MKNLKCQIRNLENITVSNEDYTAVEKELQLLGKKLLTEYVIKIGNIEVEPLWVEAYYSNSKFCVLYFHHNTDDPRSGVDICLSLCDEDKNKSKYYLSYLLKYTLVNGEFTTQSQLSAKIRKAYNSLSESDKSCIL